MFPKWHFVAVTSSINIDWTLGSWIQTHQNERIEEKSIHFNKIAFFVCAAAPCFLVVTSPLSRSSPVFDRTDSAIDLTGINGRNNTQILKLSHSPLCAWMGIGRHGKCWWRQMWKVPMMCVQCLGLSSLLQLFLCKNTGRRGGGNASLQITCINYLSHAHWSNRKKIFRYTPNQTCIISTERSKRELHKAEVKKKCTVWLC